MADDQVRNVMGIPIDGALGARAAELLDNAILDGSLFTGVTTEERIRRDWEGVTWDDIKNIDPGAIGLSIIIFAVIFGFFGYAWIASGFAPETSYPHEPTQAYQNYPEGSDAAAYAMVVARDYDSNGNVTSEYTLRDSIPSTATIDTNTYARALTDIQINRQMQQGDAETTRMQREVPSNSGGVYPTYIPPGY